MEGRKKENKPRFGSMCPFSFFKRLNTSIFGSFQKEKREKKRFNGWCVLHEEWRVVDGFFLRRSFTEIHASETHFQNFVPLHYKSFQTTGHSLKRRMWLNHSIYLNGLVRPIYKPPTNPTLKGILYVKSRTNSLTYSFLRSKYLFEESMNFAQFIRIRSFQARYCKMINSMPNTKRRPLPKIRRAKPAARPSKLPTETSSTRAWNQTEWKTNHFKDTNKKLKEKQMNDLHVRKSTALLEEGSVFVLRSREEGSWGGVCGFVWCGGSAETTLKKDTTNL